MLSQREHNALARLFRGAMGNTSESRKIAFWLLVMEGAEDIRNVYSLVHGLSDRSSTDIRIIAEAARRENKHPAELGRFEYCHNMTNIMDSMGLYFTQKDELREWLKKDRRFSVYHR